MVHGGGHEESPYRTGGATRSFIGVEVPDYIQSGNYRYPNFLGATEEQIQMADEAVTVDVTAEDQRIQTSAAERSVDLFTESVDSAVPGPGEIAGAVGSVVAVIALFVTAVWLLGQYLTGRGRGAAS